MFSGQKTYNGVAILARCPLEMVQLGVPGLEDPQRRAIAATVGQYRIINLYVVNGQAIGSEKYAYKLHWLAAVHDWVCAQRQEHPNMIVLGDFNIAPESLDVYDPAVWNDDHLLTSTAERDALKRLLACGLFDAFRQHHPEDRQFSWWDYRAGAFARNRGLRIDLTLVSTALRSQLAAAGIDRAPRTWERPSDHVPVWLSLRPAEHGQ